MPDNVSDYLCKSDSNASLAFLLPSLSADVAVKSFFSNGKVRENYAASSLAAAAFLHYARGLPLDEISVETPAGIFDVIRLDGNGEFGVLLRKCKVLCSKSLTYAASIELCAIELLTKCGVVRIFECPDSDAFRAEALSVLSLGSGEENVCAAVALSSFESRVKMKLNRVNSDKESPLLDAILAAATLMSKKRSAHFPLSIELGGFTYRVAEISGMLWVSSPISFMPRCLPYF